MTVEEIFSELSAHMIKGIMNHEEFANYYDFLGLKGYKKCHEYHFYDEMNNYRKLVKYYINHYSKLIPFVPIEQPDIIPSSWYSHIREDVDPTTKKNAVKTGLTAWVNWEKATKRVYQQMYSELFDLGEIAASNLLLDYIEDVDCELKKAEHYMLDKQAINYDINDIINEQKAKHEKYKKKLCGLEIK